MTIPSMTFRQTVYLPCKACDGNGAFPDRDSALCSVCEGSGKILFIIGSTSPDGTCAYCGLRLDRPGPRDCPACSGSPTTLLNGWTCGNCKVFNGDAKEWLKECRGCGQPSPMQKLDRAGFAVSSQLSQERAELETTIKDLRAKLEETNELLYGKAPVPPSTDQPMKYVIQESREVLSDGPFWWNSEAEVGGNWDIRSRATVYFHHQGAYIVSTLRAARIAPNAVLVPVGVGDQSPADNLPPPADNAPPPADKDASPMKDQTMRIDLGIQAHWPSGNCHGCGRHYEIPGVLGTDLTWPFLTLHLQAYTDKEKREEITIQAAAVLCPDCSKAINNAFEHNRWILNQVSPPPADKAPSPITAPEVPSPAKKSAVDDLIRQAELALLNGTDFPLQLIQKLVAELKAERATCLLQRATIKDLRIKLERTAPPAPPPADKGPKRRIVQLILSPGSAFDRLFALDDLGQVWTLDTGAEWTKLPPIGEEG